MSMALDTGTGCRRRNRRDDLNNPRSNRSGHLFEAQLAAGIDRRDHLNEISATGGLGCPVIQVALDPAARHDPLPGRPRQRRLRRRCAAAALPYDPPARSQNPAAIRDREQTQHAHGHRNHDRTSLLPSPTDAGRAAPRAFF